MLLYAPYNHRFSHQGYSIQVQENKVLLGKNHSGQAMEMSEVSIIVRDLSEKIIWTVVTDCSENAVNKEVNRTKETIDQIEIEKMNVGITGSSMSILMDFRTALADSMVKEEAENGKNTINYYLLSMNFKDLSAEVELRIDEILIKNPAKTPLHSWLKERNG